MNLAFIWNSLIDFQIFFKAKLENVKSKYSANDKRQLSKITAIKRQYLNLELHVESCDLTMWNISENVIKTCYLKRWADFEENECKITFRWTVQQHRETDFKRQKKQNRQSWIKYVLEFMRLEEQNWHALFVTYKPF